jgi:hypothetical protein
MLTRAVSGACVAVASALLLAFPAEAQLESIDLVSPGDGLVTRDTQTGLEWLDLTLTAGQSVAYWLGNNCNGVPECPPGGWFQAGWRMAVASEVCDLLNQIDSDPDPPCPSIYEQLANPVGLDMSGITCHQRATGAPLGFEAFFDDGLSANRVGSAFMLSGFRLTDVDRYTWNYAGVPCNTTLDQGNGTFLVRQGPLPDPPVVLPSLAPGGLLIVGALLGFAGGGLARRRIAPRTVAE